MTIRRKLITIQLMTVAIVLFLASIVFVWNDLVTYRASSVSRLRTYAEMIGNNTISSLEFVDPGAAAEILASLSVAQGITHACIYDPSGEIFATYALESSQDHAFPDGPGEGHAFSEEALELYFQVYSEGELVSTVFVRSNLDAFTDKTREFAIKAGLVLVVGLVLAFVLAVMLQRTLSGRIEALSAAAKEVSESGQYDHRVPGGGSDEIGVLSTGFNVMLSQIQLRDGELRKARDTLEDRVQERTEELEDAKNEALSLAKEADAANRSKSVFLANVSHEIRTPLNAITGFAEILNGQIIDPQQKAYLESIKSSGDSLLSLISDILDLSKLESGDLDLHLIDMHLVKAFGDIENKFRPLADKKGLAFDLRLDSNLPQAIEMDETRFVQILSNLIDNAIKFTKAGQVCVDARTKTKDGKMALNISISDTGIGIPQDQIDKVFAPFTQKQDQSINEYGGTGLGLTLTKRLLDVMGGQVAVISQVDAGSTFEVTLQDVTVTNDTPIGDQTPSESSEVASEEPDGMPLWSVDALTETTRAQLPKLLDEMTGRAAYVADLSETLTVNEVDDFAVWVKGLGDQCELPPLVSWADNLAQQASLFEMENMADTLKSYPDLLEEIRSLSS